MIGRFDQPISGQLNLICLLLNELNGYHTKYCFNTIWITRLIKFIINSLENYFKNCAEMVFVFDGFRLPDY